MNNEVAFDGVISDGTGTTAILVNTAGTQMFNNLANTYSGGTIIQRGFARFKEDGSFGAAPATPTVNITLDGATASLMNSGGAQDVAANRTILIGPGGGGFKSGWNASSITAVRSPAPDR